jgi:hypothetical protein
MVYFVNASAYGEFHQIQSTFGDVVKGNLQVILVMYWI